MSYSEPPPKDPTKVSLKYMKPNKIFQLAVRCPQIRATEKLIPLKIESLTFGDMSTTVNNTTYQLGVSKEFPAGESTSHFDESFTGAKFDIDEFGDPDYSADDILTPGDIDLREHRRREHGDNGFPHDFWKIIMKSSERQQKELKPSPEELVKLEAEKCNRRRNNVPLHWLENNKSVGTLYSFGFEKVESAEKCLQEMRSRFLSARLIKDQGRSITYSLADGGAHVRVFYEQILPKSDQSDWKVSYWFLHSKVVEAY